MNKELMDDQYGDTDLSMGQLTAMARLAKQLTSTPDNLDVLQQLVDIATNSHVKGLFRQGIIIG